MLMPAVAHRGHIWSECQHNDPVPFPLFHPWIERPEDVPPSPLLAPRLESPRSQTLGTDSSQPWVRRLKSSSQSSLPWMLASLKISFPCRTWRPFCRPPSQSPWPVERRLLLQCRHSKTSSWRSLLSRSAAAWPGFAAWAKDGSKVSGWWSSPWRKGWRCYRSPHLYHWTSTASPGHYDRARGTFPSCLSYAALPHIEDRRQHWFHSWGWPCLVPWQLGSQHACSQLAVAHQSPPIPCAYPLGPDHITRNGHTQPHPKAWPQIPDHPGSWQRRPEL